MLNVERGDAIIIGASKADHLKQNMETVKAGPLSDAVVDAFEKPGSTVKRIVLNTSLCIKVKALWEERRNNAESRKSI